MLSLAEMMLTGGDFLADLDVRRADEAAAGLRAVSVPPASTTAAQLARRLDDDGVAGIEAAVATLVGRAWKLLPRRRRRAAGTAPDDRSRPDRHRGVRRR